MRTGSGKCRRKRGDSEMSLSSNDSGKLTVYLKITSASADCNLCIFFQHLSFRNLSSRKEEGRPTTDDPQSG